MPSPARILGLAVAAGLMAFCLLKRIDPFYGILGTFAICSWAPVAGRWLRFLGSVGVGAGFAFGLASVIGLAVQLANDPAMVTADISRPGPKQAFIVAFLCLGLAGAVVSMVSARFRSVRASGDPR